jgi:hypothetical protein
MSTVYLVWVSDSREPLINRDYVAHVCAAEDVAILNADNQMQNHYINCTWVVKWTVDVSSPQTSETIYQVGNGAD